MLYAGIDIGGTNTLVGIVDDKGKVCAYDSFLTKDYAYSIDAYLSAISTALLEMIREHAAHEEICGIGIGAPNGNFYTGSIEHAANLPWKEDIPIVDILTRNTSLRAILTNDANAIAMGEMIYGAAKHMKNFYEITLGTGVGSGIVINGQLVYGHDGKAGELGHVLVDLDGRKCGCGRVGCLETYCSATGLVQTAKELLATTDCCTKNKLQHLTARDVYDMAEEGNPLAQQAFYDTGFLLGRKLADFATFASPEAIILFGGLTRAEHWLFDPMKRAFDMYMLKAISKPKLMLSALKSDSAAILGAAALAHTLLE